MEFFIINTIVVLFIGKFGEDRERRHGRRGILNWNISRQPCGCDYLTFTNIHILQGRLFWLRASKGKGVKFSRNLILSNLQHQYRYILFSIFNVNITAISTEPICRICNIAGRFELTHHQVPWTPEFTHYNVNFGNYCILIFA